MVTWLNDGNKLYNIKNVDVVKLVTTKSGEKGMIFGIIDIHSNTITYSNNMIPIKRLRYLRLIVDEISGLLGQQFILVKKKSEVIWYNKMSIRMIEFTPKAGSIAMIIHLIGGIRVDARTFKTPSEVNAYLFGAFASEIRNGNIAPLESDKKNILKVLSM